MKAQKQLWFKAKSYGYGWYPAAWQGWAITIGYVVLIMLFASTIDESSPPNEVAFTFFLPMILLTIAFIRIAYLTGEKPEWRWGNKKK